MLRTKIVCTLGPATQDPDVVLGMAKRGMNVARINMSHGSYEAHTAAVKAVREASQEVGRPIAVMADLQGPKIRVGSLSSTIHVGYGEEVVLAHTRYARPGDLPVTYEPLARDTSKGDIVFIDDGRIELRRTDDDPERARFEVVYGGPIRSNKGINLPTAELSTPSLTEKDLADLDFALGLGIECIALSFVRDVQDVIDLKDRVSGQSLVVSKIEKVMAIHQIEAILTETDMAMIARGDLGVELPFERVPLVQKRIIQLANYYARPVITATQMLESMLVAQRPTRAEASDVANAILDGTDAVMLSGETAVGTHPLTALDALIRIGTEIERSGFLVRGPRYLHARGIQARGGASSREHAVAKSTVDAVRRVGAPAIIVLTRSGSSARLVSSYRPSVPIFAVTPDRYTHRQLAAVWGVRPVLASRHQSNYQSQRECGRNAVLESGIGEPGAPVPVTAGIPFDQSGSTNMMRLETL